jgi:hypothetical protein
MGFNFGAFVGGLSTGMVKGIEDAEERKFKFDMLAEEEATRLRLARASERRADRKALDERISSLKAIGLSDTKAAWVAKGGNSVVSQYLDWGGKALAKGINPDTMLDSSLFSSDLQDPRNEAAMAASLGQPLNRKYTTAEPFELRTDIMTSVLGEDKEDKVKQYGSVAAGYAGTFSLLQDAKDRNDPDDISRFTTILGEWEKQLEEEIARNKDDSADTTSYFNDDSYARVQKDELTEAYSSYDFVTDVNGNITAKLEGREGVKYVAQLSAANRIENIATIGDTGVVDKRMQQRAESIRTEADRKLRTYARGVVFSDGGKDQATKKFGYLKGTGEGGAVERDDNGNIIPLNYRDALINGDNGQYKVGDVVVAKVLVDGVRINKIFVWTGLATGDTYDIGGNLIESGWLDAGFYGS